MPEDSSVYPDVLAQRYASARMRLIWSPEERVRSERQLWLAVLTAQEQLGVSVPAGAIQAYQAVAAQVDLASISAPSSGGL